MVSVCQTRMRYTLSSDCLDGLDSENGYAMLCQNRLVFVFVVLSAWAPFVVARQYGRLESGTLPAAAQTRCPRLKCTFHCELFTVHGDRNG